MAVEARPRKVNVEIFMVIVECGVITEALKIWGKVIRKSTIDESSCKLFEIASERLKIASV